MFLKRVTLLAWRLVRSFELVTWAPVAGALNASGYPTVALINWLKFRTMERWASALGRWHVMVLANSSISTAGTQSMPGFRVRALPGRWGVAMKRRWVLLYWCLQLPLQNRWSELGLVLTPSNTTSTSSSLSLLSELGGVGHMLWPLINPAIFCHPTKKNFHPGGFRECFEGTVKS